MKSKNVKELTKLYYPETWELEQEALRKLVVSVCGSYADVTNLLLRGDICSIEDLHNTSEDKLKKLRNVGPTKLEAILEVKRFINFMLEEES